MLGFHCSANHQHSCSRCTCIVLLLLLLLLLLAGAVDDSSDKALKLSNCLMVIRRVVECARRPNYCDHTFIYFAEFYECYQFLYTIKLSKKCILMCAVQNVYSVQSVETSAFIQGINRETVSVRE